MTARTVSLPPGQRLTDAFVRFGTDLSRPAPTVPADPVLAIGGPAIEPFDLPLAELAALPRRELKADFHCVTGWSCAGLRWEGVELRELYRALVEPVLRPGAVVTHLRFEGLDRYESVVRVEDALADEVLLADRLDGEPLDGDHGAPLRLLSPAQYGYVSTKHLRRIEFHTSDPGHGPRSPFTRFPGKLLAPHPHARVWQEERHRYLPGWTLRGLYRATIAPIRRSAAR